MIRLFEEQAGGTKIEEIKRILRIKGFFVKEIKEAEPHLEITVSPKKREEVEKILEEYGCLIISSEPQKTLKSFSITV